jgi:hypothetical protein
MKKIIFLFLFVGLSAIAQESPNNGFIPSRLTTSEITAFVNPAVGLVVFDTTLKQIVVNTGTSAAPVWSALSAGNSPIFGLFRANASQTLNANGTKVAFGTTVVAGGAAITYDSTNKTFTLPANRTYRLDFNAGWGSFGNGQYMRIAIYNSTTNTAISPTVHLESVTGSSPISLAPTVVHYVTVGSTPLVIDVRRLAGDPTSFTLGDAGNGGNFSTLSVQSVD